MKRFFQAIGHGIAVAAMWLWSNVKVIGIVMIFVWAASLTVAVILMRGCGTKPEFKQEAQQTPTPAILPEREAASKEISVVTTRPTIFSTSRPAAEIKVLGQHIVVPSEPVKIGSDVIEMKPRVITVEPPVIKRHPPIVNYGESTSTTRPSASVITTDGVIVVGGYYPPPAPAPVVNVTNVVHNYPATMPAVVVNVSQKTGDVSQKQTASPVVKTRVRQFAPKKEERGGRFSDPKDARSELPPSVEPPMARMPPAVEEPRYYSYPAPSMAASVVSTPPVVYATPVYANYPAYYQPYPSYGYGLGLNLSYGRFGHSGYQHLARRDYGRSAYARPFHSQTFSRSSAISSSVRSVSYKSVQASANRSFRPVPTSSIRTGPVVASRSASSRMSGRRS